MSIRLVFGRAEIAHRPLEVRNLEYGLSRLNWKGCNEWAERWMQKLDGGAHEITHVRRSLNKVEPEWLQ
jgi:hypothetical protein